MSLATVLQGAKDVRARFGWRAAGLHLLHHLLNRVMFFDCLEVILLERSDLKPVPEAQRARFDARLATRAELEVLQQREGWGIGADKLQAFDAGDPCVLSLLDGEIAGYTWVHARGMPELIPGLQLHLPAPYLYNYAGFTAPASRGAGLQSLRHHSVLEQPTWADRRGLIGYVRWVNFPSKKGQGRSGYRKVGAIWLLGSRHRYAAWFTPSLRRLGIGRLRPPPLAPLRPSTDV